MNTGYVKFKGVMVEPFYAQPDDVSPATPGNGVIPAGASVVVCLAGINGVDDWVTLPSLAQVQDGHTIKIIGNSAGLEVRTPASSAEEINSEDCDGTKEYAIPSGYEVHYFTKINNTIGWMGAGYTAIGAKTTAVVPD